MPHDALRQAGKALDAQADLIDKACTLLLPILDEIPTFVSYLENAEPDEAGEHVMKALVVYQNHIRAAEKNLRDKAQMIRESRSIATERLKQLT